MVRPRSATSDVPLVYDSSTTAMRYPRSSRSAAHAIPRVGSGLHGSRADVSPGLTEIRGDVRVILLGRDDNASIGEGETVARAVATRKGTRRVPRQAGIARDDEVGGGRT